MKILIFGATSYIAKDLILSFCRHEGYFLFLFVRDPSAMYEWLEENDIDRGFLVCEYEEFGLDIEVDVIINFIGVGNLEKVRNAGERILNVTNSYDNMAVNYVCAYPACKYIYISSGAVYNSDFKCPACIDSEVTVPINNIKNKNWYSIAKIISECRHRSMSRLPIVDVRIFNYVSATMNIGSGGLISDVVSSIKYNNVMYTSERDIVRDYIGPEDFFQIVLLILQSDPHNFAYDCYTKSPVGKIKMLEVVSEKYGLRYVVDENDREGIAGFKDNYYSINYSLNELGFVPKRTSMENILNTLAIIFN